MYVCLSMNTMKKTCFLKSIMDGLTGKFIHRFQNGRTHKRTDGNTDCETDIQTDNHKNRQIDEKTDRRTERLPESSDGKTYGWIDRQSDLQTAKQKDKNIHFGICV